MMPVKCMHLKLSKIWWDKEEKVNHKVNEIK